MASIYAVRPKSGAPVSTPPTWDELDKLENAAAFNLSNMPARLKKVGDLRKDLRNRPYRMEDHIDRLG